LITWFLCDGRDVWLRVAEVTLNRRAVRSG